MQKAGHVVVCGVDDTALRTIEQLLAAGADVVVVDAVAEAGAVAERLLEQWDVPLVRGRLREALAEARLPDAAAVVCLAADDLAAWRPPCSCGGSGPRCGWSSAWPTPRSGTRWPRSVGEGSVLDVAALAAPAVVEICLGRRGPRADGRRPRVPRRRPRRRRRGHPARAVRRAGAVAVIRRPAPPRRVPQSRRRRAPRRPGDGRRHASRSSPTTARSPRSVERLRPQARPGRGPGARPTS